MQNLQNSKIYLAPYNEPSISLQQDLKKLGIEICGFIDSNKKGDNIFLYIEGGELKYDFIIISSDRYWREIAENFDKNRILLSGKYKNLISYNDYLRILDEQNSEFDILILANLKCDYKNAQNIYNDFTNCGLKSAIVSLQNKDLSACDKNIIFFDTSFLIKPKFAICISNEYYGLFEQFLTYFKKQNIKTIGVFNKNLHRDDIVFLNNAYHLCDEILCENTNLAKQILNPQNKNEKFCIDESYTHRQNYYHYDAQENTDDWQLEIYLHALRIMRKNGFKKIADFGCGSGYKLIQYLGEFETYGLELPVNLEFLNKKYPNRIWLDSSFDKNLNLNVDLLICCDVIEHLENPDELMDYFKKLSFQLLLISTPVKELLYKTNSLYFQGPPENPAHLREWGFLEFKRYISQYFDIIDHRITNVEQATQMILAKIKTIQQGKSYENSQK